MTVSRNVGMSKIVHWQSDKFKYSIYSGHKENWDTDWKIKQLNMKNNSYRRVTQVKPKQRCTWMHICVRPLNMCASTQAEKFSSLLPRRGSDRWHLCCRQNHNSLFSHSAQKCTTSHFSVEPATNLNRDTVAHRRKNEIRPVKYCKTCQGVQQHAAKLLNYVYTETSLCSVETGFAVKMLHTRWLSSIRETKKVLDKINNKLKCTYCKAATTHDNSKDKVTIASKATEEGKNIWTICMNLKFNKPKYNDIFLLGTSSLK